MLKITDVREPATPATSDLGRIKYGTVFAGTIDTREGIWLMIGGGAQLLTNVKGTPQFGTLRIDASFGAGYRPVTSYRELDAELILKEKTT